MTEFFICLVTHEPDSKTLTSDIRELVGKRDPIQKHLGPVDEVWGVKPPTKTGGLGRRSPPNIKKVSEFQYKIDHISLTKYRKNQKVEFLFVSAHCASFL